MILSSLYSGQERSDNAQAKQRYNNFHSSSKTSADVQTSVDPKGNGIGVATATRAPRPVQVLNSEQQTHMHVQPVVCNMHACMRWGQIVLSTSCPFHHSFELSVELVLRKRRWLVVASTTLRRRVLAKRVVFAERPKNDEVWLPLRACLGLVRVQVPAPRKKIPISTVTTVQDLIEWIARCLALPPLTSGAFFEQTTAVGNPKFLTV